MRIQKRVILFVLCFAMGCTMVGCGKLENRKKIIRIASPNSTTHPDHIALLAFKDYVESRLGDKYEVEIYPNELLGSSQRAIELVQTGAVEYVVCLTSILESFDDTYQIFSLPYVFDSMEGFKAVMDNEELMEPIYESTEAAGIRAVTYYNAGVRNIYTADKLIEKPEDLKGLKIRVQQSAANVEMMNRMGGAGVPMSYGEIYTGMQQGVIDGAENSELVLVNMKHGEVAKYYSYTEHQYTPDMLVANVKFLENLSPEEREVFDEAAKISTEVELEEWDKQIAEAKEQAEEMGVTFVEVDTEPFRERVQPMVDRILKENPKLQSVYDEIQEIQNNLEEKNE